MKQKESGLVLLFLCCFAPLWAQDSAQGDTLINKFFSENKFFPKGQLYEKQELLDRKAAQDEDAILARKTAANEQNMSEEDLFDEDEDLYAQESGSDVKSAAAHDPFYDDFDDLMFFETAGLVFEAAPVIEARSFFDVFPNLSPTQIRSVRSDSGMRHAFEKDEAPLFFPAKESGVELLEYVVSKKPSHIVEALILVPYNKRELDMLDAYNAMREISGIKDQTLQIRNNDYRVFRDTTRLESAKNRKPIPDPAPADTLPYSETMYVRFTDATIGELYIRGDITPGLYGITYSMTNFRDVNYSIFKVMKAERFSANIYVEPVKEGVLIYSLSGLYLPGFIVSRMNLPTNMNYRITVLLNWIINGLRTQETTREKSVPFAVN